MRKILGILGLILMVTVTSCEEASDTPIDEPTAIFSPTIVSTETSTPTHTATLTPSLTPTPPLEESLMNFEIEDDVPNRDAEEIKMGIEFARLYMRDNLGGDITSDFRTKITVKIVADGNGNDGSCCTSMAETGARPFFDVLHSNWDIGGGNDWSNNDHHVNAGAHEYVHAWQYSLGCIGVHYQPMSRWFSEGMAQYVSINSLVLGGNVSKNDYETILARSTMEYSSHDLANLGNIWPGDIGFVAVNMLVDLSSDGQIILRDICEKIGSGQSFVQAFSQVYGFTLSEFYSLFSEFQDLGRK
jgi:hypothetical protein